MKWKFLQLLLKVLISITILFIAANTVKSFTSPPIELTKVAQPKETIDETHYIISKELIMSKLQSKSQIVSLEQIIEKAYTDVDKRWSGERHTELHIKGTYKMGLETKSIKINYIDSHTGTVYISLGESKLISLEIPYDQIKFDKSQGFFRLSMNADEEKKFYKSVEKSVRDELMNSEDVLRQAELFNQEHVREILKLIPNVRGVVFE